VTLALRPIIFDCDGTLVDSERVYAASNARIFAAYGAPVPAADLHRLYSGMTVTRMVSDIEARYGVAFPPAFFDQFEAAAEAALAAHLEPVAGVPALLSALHAAGHPIAVASNSDHARIRSVLALTGLLPFFGERFAGSDMVERPKPAPDVYWHAAKLIGADPAQCLAVEDSPTGVLAAVAAGMTVVGYTDPEHPYAEARLLEAGAHRVITDMGALLTMLDVRA
jgi:HAD superfamily hydrolase (TIGR01509 family)